MDPALSSGILAMGQLSLPASGAMIVGLQISSDWLGLPEDSAPSVQDWETMLDPQYAPRGVVVLWQTVWDSDSGAMRLDRPATYVIDPTAITVPEPVTAMATALLPLLLRRRRAGIA